METLQEKCPGSGFRPAEQVILDTVVGVEPNGTCQVCQRIYTLDFYRIPDHPALEELCN